MLSYPYILAVFQAILAKSDAIGGRVYMAPFWASELNSDNLQQIVADSLDGLTPKRYPLCLILPPVADVDAPSSTTAGAWDTYTINQLFLKQEGRTSDGQIQDVNPLINNSTHTIVQDWHDMNRVAVSFLRMLRSAVIYAELGKYMRPTDRIPFRIVPVTRLGNDKLNGVLASYRIQVFESCGDIEDYPDGAIDDIILPIGDQHPQHQL